jgi:hypothetical protein
MFRIRIQQTDSGPSFEFTTRATTLRGAKRAAAAHKDLLCFDGQGGVSLSRVWDSDGEEIETPEGSGSIPRGHTRLAWDV